MRKTFKLLWLVFLSIFPINALLQNVEFDNVLEEEKRKKGA